MTPSIFRHPPRCQNTIRQRDGSALRCPQRAHWVVMAPDGSSHHLICKPCGLFVTGVDLVAIEYVVREFAATSAEPEWPAREERHYQPAARPAPPPQHCLVCGEQVARAAYRICVGCKFWVEAQSVIGKRTLHAIGRRASEHTLAELKANPRLLHDVRNIGPKSIGWLLEVELPVREPV